MAFRIDEFVKTPDGAISNTDRTRFSCFGFDIASINSVGKLWRLAVAERKWRTSIPDRKWRAVKIERGT